MTNEKNDFTQGNILKKLALFMLPILGALVLQAAYGAVDLLVVGRFGSTSGLSAVSTGSQVLNLVTFVVTQFAMGITVLIARYLGEKKPERIGSVIGGAAVVFAVISAILFIVMIAFAHPISVLMQAPEEAVSLTTSYVRICGSGIFFIVAYNLLSAIFRGLGDSKSPLFIRSGSLYCKYFRRFISGCRTSSGCRRRSSRNCFRTGGQCSMCNRHPAEKELPFSIKNPTSVLIPNVNVFWESDCLWLSRNFLPRCPSWHFVHL